MPRPRPSHVKSMLVGLYGWEGSVCKTKKTSWLMSLASITSVASSSAALLSRWTRLHLRGGVANGSVVRRVQQRVPSQYSLRFTYRQFFTGNSNHSWSKHLEKVKRCSRGDTEPHSLIIMSSLFVNTALPLAHATPRQWISKAWSWF